MKMIFFAIIWLIGKILLLLYRVDVKGLEHLPKSGALLCPNHASNIDPVLIGLCLPLDYHLHFMAKAELFEKPALAWLIRTLGAFPVQRDIARKRSVIMDGRDIGTVVLPDADLKIYLTASAEERARRRCLELSERGTPEPYEAVLREINERDEQDMHRAIAPLREAADAIRLDTSALNFDESEQALLKLIQEKLQ